MGLSLNRVILLGNLGGDPEVGQGRGRDGKKYAKFTLATEFAKNVTWHYVVCFERNAEVAEKWLFKGSKCLIEGYINNYTTEEGKFGSEVIAKEVIVLTWGEGNDREQDSRRDEEPPDRYRRGKQQGGYQSRRGDAHRRETSHPGAAQHQRGRGQRTVGRPNAEPPEDDRHWPDDD